MEPPPQVGVGSNPHESYLGSKNDFVLSSMPVSYTHLDVYKRQVEKLVTGDTIERNGEYWRIIDIVKPVAAVEVDADTINLDVIRVYLAGPQP